jgi:hypothetical protein
MQTKYENNLNPLCNFCGVFSMLAKVHWPLTLTFRVRCSNTDTGAREADEITVNGIDWCQKNSIGLRLGVRIFDLNTKLRTLTGEDGSATRHEQTDPRHRFARLR